MYHWAKKGWTSRMGSQQPGIALNGHQTDLDSRFRHVYCSTNQYTSINSYQKLSRTADARSGLVCPGSGLEPASSVHLFAWRPRNTSPKRRIRDWPVVNETVPHVRMSHNSEHRDHCDLVSDIRCWRFPRLEGTTQLRWDIHSSTSSFILFLFPFSVTHSNS
jgi:hypothetical protein